MRAALGCLLGMMLLAGCATAPPREGADRVLREEVLAGTVLFAGEPLPALPEVDILGVDASMHAFLARYVDPEANAHLRLQQLVYAVINPGIFGLEYDETTRTAAETFTARTGNCLSFTNLFVALARESGLRVRYQQVDIPPDWEQRGDTFVLSRHINVLVDMGPHSQKAVDFNIDDFKASYDRHPVSDRRAQAHYYGNVGVERLQARDYRGAFLYLRKGLAVDETFPPLWTNLGALYSRAGYPRHAEASYLEALRLDGAEMVAISNLARLYERQGQAERAADMRELARIHRERNPYFRFHAAREAFLAGDYRGALAHLDYAVKRKPNEDQFMFLRGIVRLQLGDQAGARADLERAEEIAGNEALKRNYHSKLEMLLSEQQ
jgi:Flp pilus assembly protein TadD